MNDGNGVGGGGGVGVGVGSLRGGGVLQIVKERKLWVERTRAVKQNVKGFRPGFNRLLTKWLNLLQPPRIIKDYLEFIPVLDAKPLVTECPKFQVLACIYNGFTSII